MTDLPRRLRPDGQKRNKTITTETRGAPSAKGSTAASRPVVTKRTTRVYSGSGSVKVGVAGDQAVSIESTSSSPGSSTIAGDSAVVVGPLSNGGTDSAVVGRDANVSGEYCARVGFAGGMSGSRGVGLGYGISVTGDNAGAVGSTAQALANGSWAFGTDSGSAGAVASNENEMVMGTASHIVIVNGKLVIADNVGGLHQIVVSTGGALSTVAYP